MVFKDKKISIKGAKRQEYIFLFFFLLFPVLQFLIFYVGVNFNSLLLAFQIYEKGIGFKIEGFVNFIEVFKQIFITGELRVAIKNSIIQFVATLLMIPIHIMVAYAVFKKVPLHGFFKVMIFLPQLISSMVFVICAEYLIRTGSRLFFRVLRKIF